MVTQRQRYKETERQKVQETQRQGDRDMVTQRQRDMETQRQRERETRRHRDCRETERHGNKDMRGIVITGLFSVLLLNFNAREKKYYFLR
jgi:hypothetical protein